MELCRLCYAWLLYSFSPDCQRGFDAVLSFVPEIVIRYWPSEFFDTDHLLLTHGWLRAASSGEAHAPSNIISYDAAFMQVMKANLLQGAPSLFDNCPISSV